MSPRAVHLFAGVLVTALLAAVAVFPQSAEQWATEDGPIETLGALWLLVAAPVLVYQFVRGVDRRGYRALRRNLWVLALALLFVFIAGEEISWGQRILGFGTPDALSGNMQGEANIHNLEIFHGDTAEGERKDDFWASLLVMDRAFSLFWLVWCCVLPIAWRFSSIARRLLTRLRVPFPTITFGALFVGVYLASKAMEGTVPGLGTHTLVETKEAALETLLAVAGIWLWRLTPREIASRRQGARSRKTTLRRTPETSAH